MSTAPKVHFATSPFLPAYSPPPTYESHFEREGYMSFSQKERMASVAESKLQYLVSQKRREPSLREVLLHAGFLERVLDSLDASQPETIAEPQPMEEVKAGSFEVHSSLTTIVEVDDEMEVEEEDEEELTLTRTVSHRPTSPVSSDDEDSSDSDDDDLPSYSAPIEHPLINLMEVREKARREELASTYRIGHDDPSHQQMYFMNTAVAVAA